MTQGTPEQPSINPALQEILDKIPEDLHPLILPQLQGWDKQVQDQIEAARSDNPYAELAEYEVPMDRVKQALYLAQQVEQNPQEVAQRMIESFQLDYVPKSQLNNSSTPNDDDEDDFDMTDLAGLENHPAFKQIMEKVQQADQFIQERQQLEQEEQEYTELEEFLEAAHEEHGDFNDIFVTALMSQGVDAEDAIQQYKETVAQAAAALNPGSQQQDNQPPPVVMGGAGNSGSGMPDQPVPMGSLGKNALNDLAVQFLQQNLTESG